MGIWLCQTNEDYSNWDRYVVGVPGAHYYQTYGWLKSYEPMGFSPQVLVYEEEGRIAGGAAILSAKIPFLPWRVFVLPHGPLPADPAAPSWAALMQRFDRMAREQRAICATIYPHEFFGGTTIVPRIEELGFTDPMMLTAHRFSNTPVRVDLPHTTENELLLSFRPRTRQYIKKAQSGDLTIRSTVDAKTFDSIYAVFVEHGKLKGYRPRPYASLKSAWEWFAPRGEAFLYQAWLGDALVGAIFVIHTGQTAHYITGAVRREHSDHRPAELLHWHAMCEARRVGMTAYDFTSMGDRGGTQFKMGFRPVCRSWQRPRTKVYRPVTAHLMKLADQYGGPLLRWVARHRANVASSAPRPVPVTAPLADGRHT